MSTLRHRHIAITMEVASMPVQRQRQRHPGTLSVSTEPSAASSFTTLTTYLSFMVLIVFGRVRDWAAQATGRSRYWRELRLRASSSRGGEGGVVVRGWERFYARRLFNRIQDCWARPVLGRPSTWITLAEREVDRDDAERMRPRLERVGHERVLNLGSYNYLGFADDDWDATCGGRVREALDAFGISCTSGPVSQAGAVATVLHGELESQIAAFVGKEDAVVFGTGYSTNAWALKAIAGPGVLVLSDALNHTSIVNGCRASGARTITFGHNNAVDLEDKLRQAFMDKPSQDFMRILVVIEGLYSMEGHTCHLAEIVAVCQRFKAHLYVDEAHSIGALGKTGRGVCELKGVDPAHVDVLMGTFTKSFGGLGGYIAGSRALCNKLRVARAGSSGAAMSPVVAAQVLQALHLLRDTDLGRQKLHTLQENARLFRNGLVKMGCSVLGEPASPIVPIMIYHPAKLAAFSRECLARGLAVVVVGAPAVPLVGGRARFCVSASHKPEELRWALRQIKKVCKKLRMRYELSPLG